jgi:hypothetical protein
MPERSNPAHWIWSVEAPQRFTPDVEAYDIILGGMRDAQIWQTTSLLAEGMSAERIVLLWRIDGIFPPDVVTAIGGGLAWWAQMYAIEASLRGGEGSHDRP